VALQDAHLPQKDDGHQKNHHGNHQRNQPVVKETGNNRGNLAKRKQKVRKKVEQRQGEAQILFVGVQRKLPFYNILTGWWF